MNPTHTPGRMLKILAPIEKKDGSTYWMRVGTGFPGKDPSTINLFIDAFPTGNVKMLHLREMDEEDLQPRRDRRRDGGPESAPMNPRGGGNDLPF